MEEKVISDGENSRFKPFIVHHCAILSKDTPELILTRDELVELLTGYAFAIADILYEACLWPEQVSRRDEAAFCYNRRGHIENLLGLEAVKLVDKALDEYGRQQNQNHWRRFFNITEPEDFICWDMLNYVDSDSWFCSAECSDEVVLLSAELIHLLGYWHRETRLWATDERSSSDALRFGKSRIDQISKLLSEVNTN